MVYLVRNRGFQSIRDFIAQLVLISCMLLIFPFAAAAELLYRRTRP